MTVKKQNVSLQTSQFMRATHASTIVIETSAFRLAYISFQILIVRNHTFLHGITK